MAIAWEGIEVTGRLARELKESPQESKAFDEQFQVQFRVVLAEAMVRVAETELRWHREQQHFVRSFLAQRRVNQRKRELLRAAQPEVVPAVEEQPAVAAAPQQKVSRKRSETAPETETGDRVVTYLELGVRNIRNVRRA